MLTAAGVIASFDERTVNSTEKGHLGGILQSSSYIAGISGGSWLVASLAIYNNLPVTSMVKYWNVHEPLLEGVPNFDISRVPEVVQSDLSVAKQLVKRDSSKAQSLNALISQVLSKDGSEKDDTIQMKDILRYYRDLHLEVKSKKQNGFYLSFTDYWGRAIAKKVFPEFNVSPGVKMSDLPKLSSFQNFEQPLPILVSNAQSPGKNFDHLNSQIFEFTPFEFGSWDSFLGSFVKTEYLGSELFNGIPTKLKGGKPYCVKNFDNLGFITATSSSLFNNVIIYIWQVAASSKRETYNAIKSILSAFGINFDKLDDIQEVAHSDYASYSPNPFFGLRNSTKDGNNTAVNSINLFLADGGEDGENIPFQPLIQKARDVDIIFATDATSDIQNWPNGTTLKLTSERYHSKKSGYHHKKYKGPGNARYAFPLVPTPKDVISRELSKKPLFLGCDLAKYPGAENDKQTLPPLIVYLSNSLQSFSSNTSTFKLTYNQQEVNQMIQNGYNIATYQNSTIDKNFSQCVGCAILKRDFDRKFLKDKSFVIPKFCGECFKRYCWS